MSAPSIETIQRYCAGTFGVTLIDLKSDRRDAPTVRARHAAMWLARHLTPHSLPMIARHFYRDHTTVLHAVQRVQGRMQADPETAGTMTTLAAELGRLAQSDAANPAKEQGQ
ncbi:MAG TPA: helix-turn-helix domain-containing protein [Gammaproteobacteria bacterium]|nr:helix-turn-helix domain-containing protein [Gammaproteobacteria bacterium]